MLLWVRLLTLGLGGVCFCFVFILMFALSGLSEFVGLILHGCECIICCFRVCGLNCCLDLGCCFGWVWDCVTS